MLYSKDGLVPYNRQSKPSSRELRNNLTEAELHLWERLRRKHTGYKFYRQKPIGDYIVDFYCPKARLVVEVDGARHFTHDGIENDIVRDEILHGLNLTVLRFTNSEVMENTDKVMEKIIREILHSPPLQK
jgi:very-short-patch-repair endonuclease